MLTVKLMKATTHLANPMDNTEKVTRFSTKIVQGVEVDIHDLRHGELQEVAVKLDHEGRTAAFYVANRDMDPPEGFGPDTDFYYAAFIENAHGATTEAVRF